MAIITDRQINAKPDAKDRWLNETIVRGHGVLVARITPSGLRSFYFRYTDSNGKRDRMPIGNYSREEKPGCLTLTQARLKASELAGMHKNGITDLRHHFEQLENLQKAKIESKRIKLEQQNQLHLSRMSVNELFEYWVNVDLVRRKDKGAEMRRLFERDILPKIGDLAAQDIRRRHITEITDVFLSRNTPRMAKVAFSSLRQMFRFAVVREIVEADPTAAISKFNIGGQSVERDRVLTDDEIKLLAKLLPESGVTLPTQIAVWIALSTGCRIGELITAEWAHIDQSKKEWFMPLTKNGKSHTVQLSTFALKHFDVLKDISGSSRWCFPNRNNDAALCSKTINKQLQDRQRANEETQLKGRARNGQALILPGGQWTPHDLRRTAATMMVESGVLPEVAERCLNHTEQNKIKRTYQRYSYRKEMLHAWEVLGHRLESLKTP